MKKRDLTGIEAFVALDTLRCGGNLLSTLDLSNNTALTDIDCGRNLLSSLDISNKVNLGDTIRESNIPP